jgi:hypothetical protein
MGEHIALQFGNYSNHVGTHLWNSLDEQQSRGGGHEVALKRRYRVTEDKSGGMITHPRVLYLDTKGNAAHYVGEDVGIMAADGSGGGGDMNAGQSHVFSSWQGSVNSVEQPRGSSSRFLKEGSNVWGYDGNGGDAGHYRGEEEEEIDIDPWTGEEIVRRPAHGKKTGAVIQHHQGWKQEEAEEEDAETEAGEEVEEEEDLTRPIDDYEVKEWSDFLKVHLHTKSVQELPIWHDDVYNSFFSGRSSHFISSSDFEDLYDSFRFLLEECDRIASVDVSVDAITAAGGLACRMLEEIRDDIGGTVAVPLWLFTDPMGELNADKNGASDGKAKAAMVKECGIPLAYSTLSEHASVLIPVDATTIAAHVEPWNHDMSIFRSSALVASSMETALSDTLFEVVAGRQPTLGSMKAWCDAVTNRGGFPVAALEARLPMTSTQVAANGNLFSEWWSAKNKSINPALISMSSARSGRYAPKVNSATRGFTNVLCARGVTQESWMAAVRAKHAEKQFPLTSCSTFQTCIPVPQTYPDFGVARGDSFAAVSAVGTGAYLSDHMSDLAGIWAHATSRSGRNVLSQLEGVNMEEDLCNEVAERLMHVSEQMRGDW